MTLASDLLPMGSTRSKTRFICARKSRHGDHRGEIRQRSAAGTFGTDASWLRLGLRLLRVGQRGSRGTLFGLTTARVVKSCRVSLAAWRCCSLCA